MGCPSAGEPSGLRVSPPPQALHLPSCLHSLFGGSDYKLIYRHYATLYFVFCVDSSESELGILDLIQVGLPTGGHPAGSCPSRHPDNFEVTFFNK